MTVLRRRRSQQRQSTGRAVLCAVLVAGLLLAGLRMLHVHGSSWEWSLSESAAPPMISFRERTYHRADPVGVPYSGPDEQQGTTPGGGVVLAPPPAGEVPTVIGVRDGDRVVTYALSGGP